MSEKRKEKTYTYSGKRNADYIIYTDGGCAWNPGGPGGYGTVIINTKTGEFTEL